MVAGRGQCLRVDLALPERLFQMAMLHSGQLSQGKALPALRSLLALLLEALPVLAVCLDESRAGLVV